MVLRQLTKEGRDVFHGQRAGVDRHCAARANGDRKMQALLSTDQTPIHPLRLCKEVRDFWIVMPSSWSMAMRFSTLRVNRFYQRSGTPCQRRPNGCSGVAVPFGLETKVAAEHASDRVKAMARSV
jgi:hypothetical protein